MSNQAPTYEEFLAAYPAFDNSSYVTIGPAQLSLSTRLLSQTNWGDFYSDGVMLDCAHNLVLERAASSNQGMGSMQVAAGPISSVSVAGTSTSFNTGSSDGKSNSRDWYMKTSYGQKFLRLRDAVVPSGYIAG